MPWMGVFYIFTQETILRLAPAAPGVYLLWRRGAWIYVGETENIRERLLAFARGENECVSREMPTDFGYEMVPVGEQRTARHAALIRELVPICL